MRIFFSLLLFMGTLSLSAQTTTTTKTHRTNTSNSMASNINTNNGKVDSQSSTSQTTYSYKFSADFKDYKQQDIKQALMSHLDDRDLILENGNYNWQLENAEGVYFTCSLSEGALSLNLDKIIAPVGSLSKVKDLCNDLVTVISSHTNTPSQGYDPQLNKGTELEQARRELAAAQRKVERLTKKKDPKRKN